MTSFITGSTGYLGAHVAFLLSTVHGERLNLLVRAPDRAAAKLRLWKALQLHLDFEQFQNVLNDRLEIFLGDITLPHFGLDSSSYSRLIQTTDSVVHCAASLNRKSEKTCLNVNLRGTLEVIKFASKAHADHGLRRFSHVSTVAVAGVRQDEVVREDQAIDWNRSDYDPYARTKKFCEHMLRDLLPNVPLTIFRPSIVLGDSRYPQTTQFDMVEAFVFLAKRAVLPLRPNDRLDIVPVNFVAESIATLHCKERPLHDTYHLSSGEASQTCREITRALTSSTGKRGPLFVPVLLTPFNAAVNWLSNRRGTTVGHLASLLKVFLPYLVWNTVFDNSRVVNETHQAPARFTDYCYPLYEFSVQNRFSYPYQEWPSSEERVAR
ncbi:MAG: SDR family oxidoreductase [Acidobacteriota bacterium]